MNFIWTNFNNWSSFRYLIVFAVFYFYFIRVEVKLLLKFTSSAPFDLKAGVIHVFYMWCLHINVERVTRFLCYNYNKITSLECCVQNCFFFFLRKSINHIKKKKKKKSNKLCFRPNAILFIVILNCSSICLILVAKRMLILMKFKKKIMKTIHSTWIIVNENLQTSHRAIQGAKF